MEEEKAELPVFRIGKRQPLLVYPLHAKTKRYLGRNYVEYSKLKITPLSAAVICQQKSTTVSSTVSVTKSSTVSSTVSVAKSSTVSSTESVTKSSTVSSTSYYKKPQYFERNRFDHTYASPFPSAAAKASASKKKMSKYSKRRKSAQVDIPIPVSSAAESVTCEEKSEHSVSMSSSIAADKRNSELMKFVPVHIPKVPVSCAATLTTCQASEISTR
ncbi:uncharacterized protein LOC129959229 [Argiope bruennichi]|uniref:uncharacterized protein LOC129959229 n=1 Tax=Argiope bruennichi TaxID=94029 RepID=UPI0024948002|nr:uncharacterized protein LOC129959229 [Argiope bruennichi]